MTHKTSPRAVLVAMVFVFAGSASAAPDVRSPAAAVSPAAAKVPPRIRVLFSPGGGCTEAIVDAITRAKTSIDVQAYSFTSAPIAEAVAKAHERGVKVRVVLDKSQRTQRYTSATYLFNHDVPVWIDAKHAIAHNKLILIDRSLIITGSFNFTKSAETRNAENLLLIEGHPELMSAYAANFEEHLAHAEPYEGLGTPKKDSVGANNEKPKSPRKAA